MSDEQRLARFIFEHDHPMDLAPEDFDALMSIFGAPGAIPKTLRVHSMKLELVFDLGED